MCLPNKLKTNQLLIKTESWFFHSDCSNIVSFVKAKNIVPRFDFSHCYLSNCLVSFLTDSRKTTEMNGKWVIWAKITYTQRQNVCMYVKMHKDMLARQFLFSAMRPEHPKHTDINHVPPRLMKNTLVSRYSPAEKPRSSTRRSTQTPWRSLSWNRSPTKCLLPEPRKYSENTLPMKTRTTLSQLRSGYSSFLKSFLSRISPWNTATAVKDQMTHTTSLIALQTRRPQPPGHSGRTLSCHRIAGTWDRPGRCTPGRKRATTTTTTNGRSSLPQSDVQTHIFFHFWVENRTCVSSTLVEYL